MTEVIVFAHGSPVAEANRAVADLSAEVARKLQCRARCAFLDSAQPDLEGAVSAAVADGARRIVVIPYFLVMGLHVSQDLPKLMERMQLRFPGVEFRLGRSLDGHPRMADLLAGRAREVMDSR